MKLQINASYHISDITLSDKAAYLEHLQEKQIYDQTLAIPFPYTAADADWWIKHNIEATAKQDGRSVNWAIRRSDSDALIGGIGFLGLTIGEDHKSELGYWLAKPYWSKGIMTEAVKKASEYAFKEFGLSKITANVFHFNIGSARVLEKAGFQCEAHLRSHYKKDGKIFDGKLFAILNELNNRPPGQVPTLALSVLPDELAVVRFQPSQSIPDWVFSSPFYSISKTGDELSVVCKEILVPENSQCERGWCALKVHGPLDFGLIGVLASLTKPLAEAEVSVFAISTFDTDYILVKRTNLEKAISVLKAHGHKVHGLGAENLEPRDSTAVDKPILLKPIGTFRSVRDAAIDDHWDSVETSIVLDSGQFSEEAIAQLNTFSHIEVIFHMNRVSSNEVNKGARHPRGNTNWPKVGIFAQRAKNRPNQLGSTICEIKRVDGLSIHVKGLDAINGTPVLDIKPFMKEFTPRDETRQPQWASELMKDYWE